MATYTLTSGYIVCIGTDITSAGLAAAVIANPTWGTVVSFVDTKSVYGFNLSYGLQIGSSSSGPTASIWDCSNEYVALNTPSAYGFNVYGKITQGNIADGSSNSGGGFSHVGNGYGRFALVYGASGPVCEFYGSTLYADNLIQIDNYSTFKAINCDISFQDGIDWASGAVGTLTDFTNSRVHHTGAVGIKLLTGAYSPPRVVTLTNIKVEKCTYAIQTFGTVVLYDAKLDSCTYHNVPNQDDCDVTFINPDFTTLRIVYGDSLDITRIEFRYGLTIKNPTGTALASVSVRITDEQGSHRFDTVTDASGHPTTFPSGTLQNSTYVNNTKTARTNHVLKIRKYDYLWASVARTADVDFLNDLVPISLDALVTQSSGTAAAHTGITVTDHGGSPVTWNTKIFGITITGDLSVNPALTATDIWHYIKYHCALTATFNSKSGLDWHPMLDSYSSTVRSDSTYYAGVVKGVRVVDQSGNSFPGILEHQADDGTYYSAAPVVYQGLSFTGLIAGSQVKVFDHGTTTELFSTTSSGTSETFSQVRSTDITVDYTIFKDGYIPIRVTGILLTTSVLSTPIQQVIDRAFQTPSGLTFGTTATVNAGTKQFGLTTGSTIQNWYSYMVQSWRNQSALANLEFPLSANGPNSFTLGAGWVWDGSTSINHLSRDGMRYLDVSGNVTAIWAAFLSVGVPAGQQVRFEQVNGSGVTNAAATGNIDQLVQILSDPNGDGSYGDGYDYRGFMVLKVQGDGYDQAESDAVSLYGNMEDQLFVVGLTPTANGISAATIAGVTITDHGASPVTWNGKVFSITITDTTDAHTGTEILQYVRGLNNFNYHDLVQPNGSSFKTVNGNTYGGAGATVKGVRVVRADGTSAHLSFDTFTADDGTAYSPTVGIYQSVAINGLIAGSRVQIYDTTNSAELFNAVVAGTSHTWTDSVIAAGNRDIRVRIANQSAATAYNFIDANIGTCGTTALTAGISYLASQALDTTYNTNAIDGSTVTGITITPSPARVQINIAGGAVTWPQIYAYQVYWLATATGIADEAAFISAPDTANYILTAFSIRNTSATPLTITGGFGRDSVSGLVKDCIDTAGSTGNIFPMPDHAIPYSSGSGLTAGQASQITAIESSTGLSRVIDGAITKAEAERIILAALAGKRQGLGTTIEEYMSQDGITPRITLTPDAAGNGTPVINGAA